MEVLWKTVTVILNHRLTMVIKFHDNLHDFHSGIGTGTASIESKLLQHLMAMREEVLYDIFLGLHKSYGALDCSRCL